MWTMLSELFWLSHPFSMVVWILVFRSLRSPILELLPVLSNCSTDSRLWLAAKDSQYLTRKIRPPQCKIRPVHSDLSTARFGVRVLSFIFFSSVKGYEVLVVHLFSLLFRSHLIYCACFFFSGVVPSLPNSSNPNLLGQNPSVGYVLSSFLLCNWSIVWFCPHRILSLAYFFRSHLIYCCLLLQRCCSESFWIVEPQPARTEPQCRQCWSKS